MSTVRLQNLNLFGSLSDPFETEWHIPLYQVFPVIQVLVATFAVFIIGSNLFLYRFLDKQSQNSLGWFLFIAAPILRVIVCLYNLCFVVQTGGRNKRRNFVSAQIGILSSVIAFVYMLTFHIIFNFEVLTIEYV